MRDNSLDCPKCGKLLKNYTRRNGFNLDSEWACNNPECENYDIHPFETTEKARYHQRLDNILKQFLDDTEDSIYIDGKSYNIIKAFRNYNFIIVYTKEKQFISCYHAEIELEYIGVLKLKTVEHLLADLESDEE